MPKRVKAVKPVVLPELPEEVKVMDLNDMEADSDDFEEIAEQKDEFSEDGGSECETDDDDMA
ncbi:hypothetical protein K7432_015106, partial [Basidiobolus ranarum]